MCGYSKVLKDHTLHLKAESADRASLANHNRVVFGYQRDLRDAHDKAYMTETATAQLNQQITDQVDKMKAGRKKKGPVPGPAEVSERAA